VIVLAGVAVRVFGLGLKQNGREAADMRRGESVHQPRISGKYWQSCPFESLVDKQLSGRILPMVFSGQYSDRSRKVGRSEGHQPAVVSHPTGVRVRT